MTQTVTSQNLRLLHMEAMVAGDEQSLEQVYAYLVRQGWAGGVSVEEAITAVEKDIEHQVKLYSSGKGGDI